MQDQTRGLGPSIYDSSYERPPMLVPVRVETGGGGGCGDASRRPREAVLADLGNGYISPEASEQVYGVKLVQGAG